MRWRATASPVTRSNVAYTLNAALGIDSVRGDDPRSSPRSRGLYAPKLPRSTRSPADLGDGYQYLIALLAKTTRAALLGQGSFSSAAQAGADPGHRRADRPDRDPPGAYPPGPGGRIAHPARHRVALARTFLTFNTSFLSRPELQSLGARLNLRFRWKLQSTVEAHRSRAARFRRDQPARRREPASASTSCGSLMTRVLVHPARRTALRAWTPSCGRSRPRWQAD